MRTIQRLIYLSVLFQLLSTTAYSVNHYVDKNANGLNNGSSWANAWESFSAINWGSIDPGDVVYISGGTDSTVYYENLNIIDNGTATNQITIRNSQEPGHNGRVIIDGEFSRTGLITTAGYNDPSSYIYIKGFEVRNGGTDPAIQVYYGCKNITFDSLLIYENLERGFRLVGNSFETGPQNITIKNCSIITPLDVPYQTDGIYTDFTTNMRIDNSFIWARNLSAVNNHSDGLQAYRTRGWKITNSVFVCDSNAQGMAMILGAQSETSTSDSVILYNNIIINRGIWWAGNPPDVAALNTRWYSQENMPPTFLYHNTIISYGPDAEGIRIYYPVTEARNNIIAQYGSGSNPGGDGYKYTVGASYNQPVSAFSGENLYYREWSSTVNISGGSNWNPSVSGWDSFVSGGAGGFIANPEFTHNWYGISPNEYTAEISSTSPARNQGEDLQSIIEGMGFEWADRFGTPRDYTPTIGAYEYTTGGSNNPPNQPSNPNPSSGATGRPVNLTMTWTCTDPDGNPLTYDVYFGTNSNPPIASTNRTSASFTPAQLNYNTTYYWKIVAKDNQGATTSGPVWSFTTVAAIVNNPPYPPSNPNPGNGATNQPINITLNWSCTDPEGDPITYDVYFGTSNNPPLTSSNQSSASFNPGQLNNNTSYYWKIVAKDNQGSTTSGPVWSFTTVAAIVNNPPYPPSNPNPGNGATNQPINITLNWSCTDPEGNPITYDVFFGTNDEPPLISTNLSNPSFNPGMLNSNTTYYWKIVARDNQGATSSGLVWHFTTVYIDVTPPEIVNSELLDSVRLKIWFSEPLEQISAQNISNYSINNGIQILSASPSGSEVTLATTEHVSGTYTITIINVKDLVGNQISPPNNTDQYEYSTNPTQVLNLELKIFLDGPYINNSMTTDLLNNSSVPLNQPYSGSPWNYYGNETVSGIPQNSVDWILLELRTNTSASSMISRRAAFLRSDGIIVDLNGNNQITFPGVQSGSYYVVVYHRNHLAIMTKTALQLSETSSLYDFTNSQNKAYGTQPMKSLGGGNYGLYAADGNANGDINNSDNSSVWRPENGSVGYKKGDFDLNGGVNIVDKNAKWKLNKGKISYVPTN